MTRAQPPDRRGGQRQAYGRAVVDEQADRQQDHQRGDHRSRARHDRAGDVVAGRRTHEPVDPLGGDAVGFAVEGQQRGRERRGAAAAHRRRVGGELGQRLLASRQRPDRVGVPDRAREQDPQRITPAGMVALMRDDGGELVLPQSPRTRPGTRTRPGAADRRRTPVAAHRRQSRRSARRSRAARRSASGSRSGDAPSPRARSSRASRGPARTGRRAAATSAARPGHGPRRAASPQRAEQHVAVEAHDVQAKISASRNAVAPNEATANSARRTLISPAASRRSFSSRSGSSVPM